MKNKSTKLKVWLEVLICIAIWSHSWRAVCTNLWYTTSLHELTCIWYLYPEYLYKCLLYHKSLQGADHHNSLFFRDMGEKSTLVDFFSIECRNSYFYIEKWTFKVSISSVEWCFFTRYGRKVDLCRLFFLRV